MIPVLGRGRERRVPGAGWPASLAATVGSRFSERPHFMVWRKWEGGRLLTTEQEKDRDGETERQGQKETETERQTDKHKQRERGKERENHKNIILTSKKVLLAEKKPSQAVHHHSGTGQF